MMNIEPKSKKGNQSIEADHHLIIILLAIFE